MRSQLVLIPGRRTVGWFDLVAVVATVVFVPLGAVAGPQPAHARVLGVAIGAAAPDG